MYQEMGADSRCAVSRLRRLVAGVSRETIAPQRSYRTAPSHNIHYGNILVQRTLHISMG